MGRWEPDGRSRLVDAAVDLFGERGYEQTTVADIAGRAGLTERTFFRHFTDKREVLFGGGQQLGEMLVAHVAAAPASTAPLRAIVLALQEAGKEFFEPIRANASRRQAIITAHADLQERELIKLARITADLAEVLGQRGLDALTARLAAETGVAVFKTAFEQWATTDVDSTLSELVAQAAQQLTELTKRSRLR